MILVIIALMMAISSAQDIYEVSLERSDTSEQSKNSHCNGKCIKFSIQDVEVPEKDLNAEECWKLTTCVGFPKIYKFRHINTCKTHCGVNHHMLNGGDYVLYWDVCIEESHEDNPMPNIC